MITIELCTSTDAFGKTYAERGSEAARILRELADKYEQSMPSIECLVDLDGNAVGTSIYSED